MAAIRRKKGAQGRGFLTMHRFVGNMEEIECTKGGATKGLNSEDRVRPVYATHIGAQGS